MKTIHSNIHTRQDFKDQGHFGKVKSKVTPRRCTPTPSNVPAKYQPYGFLDIALTNFQTQGHYVKVKGDTMTLHTYTPSPPITSFMLWFLRHSLDKLFASAPPECPWVKTIPTQSQAATTICTFSVSLPKYLCSPVDLVLHFIKGHRKHFENYCQYIHIDVKLQFL